MWNIFFGNERKRKILLIMTLLAVLLVTDFMLQSFYSKLDLETEPLWRSFNCLWGV
jgi:hypothetical protein